MKRLFLLLILVSSQVHALDAVVTVLEAPLFKEKSYDALVVQYLRKGDVIKIHPSIANTRRYDHLAPPPEKLAKIKQDLAASDEWKDPLFKDTEYPTYYIEDEFIPTLDRQGNTVYILSDHVYVYFGDSREFSQQVPKRDPTDYRLEEPLPRNYPFFNPSGYRGMLLLGFSQPYNESYSYPDPVKTKSYMNPAELYVGILRQVPYDKQDRFFFGGNFHIRTFENTYSFFDFRQSQEKYLVWGIGPLISYDAFKGEEHRINLSASITLNPFNYLLITQRSSSTTESRPYNSFSLSSRLGLQYHRKKIVNDLDFVLGTSFDIEGPATYRARSSAGQASWWENLGDDAFTTRPSFTLTGFIGLQVAY